jgi:hypothetical protein
VKRLAGDHGSLVRVPLSRTSADEDFFNTAGSEGSRRPRTVMKNLHPACVWVESDNEEGKANFVDSRTRWGELPRALLVGRVAAIVWPPERWRVIS